MPFLYVYVCDLLEKLGELVSRDVPVLIGLKEKTNSIAIKWLAQHRNRLNELSVNSKAVMAMFMPELRTGWEYGLDGEALERLIARALNLPRNLHEELRMWRNGPAHGDLGACLEHVMDKMTREIATRATATKVTVEGIDDALTKIASHNLDSSSQVRSLAVKVKTHDPIELLGKLYKSLGGREAKWLTRFILKDYGPVKFPNKLDFSHNALLPRCVRMNAEISITDAFPMLIDGTSAIRGTSSARSAAKQTPSTPMVTVGGTASTRLTVHPLQTLPTATRHPSSSAPIPSSPRPYVALPRTREPLASLAPNIASSQSFGTGTYEPSSSMPTFPTLSNSTRKLSQPTSSSQAAASRTRHAGSPHHSRASQPKSPVPMIISGTGTCGLTSHRCPLINCIFILSPCISNSPYILEQLLPWHGCCIVTTLRGLSEPSLPRRCPQTGKKYRKIALVEPNRTEQTVQFLKRIEKLNLRRRKGREKQWVEVYDWRLLECAAKVDKGKELGYNLWRRCWMGAA